MGLLFSKIWKRVFRYDEVKILMLGLDNAGKSTILKKLNFGKLNEIFVSIGFTYEQINIQNISILSWDTFRSRTRKYYSHPLYQNTRGIIFVIDSVDTEQMNDAYEELFIILNHDLLRGIALLVLANKQDLLDAITVDEISYRLSLIHNRDVDWFIQKTCGITGDGIIEGLEWLFKKLEIQFDFIRLSIK